MFVDEEGDEAGKLESWQVGRAKQSIRPVGLRFSLDMSLYYTEEHSSWRKNKMLAGQKIILRRISDSSYFRC